MDISALEMKWTGLMWLWYPLSISLQKVCQSFFCVLFRAEKGEAYVIEGS
jgi:hypothetical protein